jgi:hypothetical protein
MSNEINVIRELMTWIRTNTGKSVNFSVNHWSFKADGSETTEYKLWVDELINKSTETIDELISLIPSIKQYCTLNMELAA